MSQEGWYRRRSSELTRKELRGYGETRRQLYPTTYLDDIPSEETKADHDSYSARLEEAKEYQGKYKAEYKREKSSMSKEEVERVSGLPLIDSLSSNQHERLVRPAREAEVHSAAHAHTRDRFLVKHPYGYKTHEGRKEHDKNVNRAYREANEYRQKYDTHSRGSRANPVTRKSGAGYSADPHPASDTYYQDTYYDDGEDDEDDEDDRDRRAVYHDSSDEGGKLPVPSRTNAT